MKTQFIAFIFSILTLSLTAQEFLSVTVVPSKLTYAGTGQVDIYGNPLEGANFALAGYIYPGDFFDANCPDSKDCGITLVLTQDTVYAFPDDAGAVIGRWEMFGITTQDVGKAIANGGNATFSTQVFLFSEDFEECPGCKIVTEGKDYYGGVENESFKRTIAGGTTEAFRLVRGEVDQIVRA
jgi:hypothetical protein